MTDTNRRILKGTTAYGCGISARAILFIIFINNIADVVDRIENLIIYAALQIMINTFFICWY